MSKTLARVIDRVPEWDALPSDLPPVLGRFLRGCLEKDPRARVRDIGDVRLAIRGVFEATDGDLPAAGATPRLRLWQRPGAVAAAALLIITLAAALAWSLTRPAPVDQVARFADTLPGPRGSNVSFQYQMAVSPDGSRLVYAAGDQLHLRSLNQTTWTPLRGTDGAVEPFFSPDGESVAFWADGALRRVAVTGGPAVTVAEASTVYGATWGADDLILLNISGTGIVRVSANGGEPELLIGVEGSEVGLARPQLLPDGEWVLFSVYPGGQAVIESLVTGERRVLIEDGGGDARYLATGHLVYALDGTLFAQAFDTATLSLSPGPVPLVEGVRQSAINNVAHFDVSRDGSLAYLPASNAGRPTLGWVDREGTMTPLLDGGEQMAFPRLSPDGRRIALSVANDTTDIWLYDVDGTSSARLTEEGQSNANPLWTPDGSAVTFASNRTGTFDLYQKATDGSSPAELVLESEVMMVPGGWSPDGDTLVYYEASNSASRDISILRRDGAVTPFLATAFNERAPRLSPNGRWLAYMSDQSGDDRVYVQAFPDGGAVIPISTGGGSEPVWSPDGRELFYRDGDRMMVAAVDAGDTFTAERPRLLFEATYETNPAGIGSPNYDVAADGRLLMIRTSELGAGNPPGPQVNIVLNWHSELLERVPSP